MNKQNYKIIAYIDGSLTIEEVIQFEKAMAGNAELKNEVEKIRYFLAQSKTVAEPSYDEHYFINLLPAVHNKLSRGKKFSFAKMAYSLSTVAAVILIVFLLFSPNKTNENTDINQVALNLTEQEINETLNQYENRYSLNDLLSSVSTKTDSLVNNMVESELDLTSGAEDKIIADNYLNTDEMLNSLNENEANELYSQLINTDIIKRVRQ